MISRADIRRMLLESGKWTDETPMEAKVLDKAIDGYYAWYTSPLIGELNRRGLDPNASPRKMLDGLQWRPTIGSGAPSKTVETRILEALQNRQAIKIIGASGFNVATAVAKQVSLMRGWKVSYEILSDFLTRDKEEGEMMGEGERSVLLLDISGDTLDGKVFLEIKSRVISWIRSHQGALIILSSTGRGGQLDQIVQELVKPSVTETVEKAGTKMGGSSWVDLTVFEAP